MTTNTITKETLNTDNLSEVVEYILHDKVGWGGRLTIDHLLRMIRIITHGYNQHELKDIPSVTKELMKLDHAFTSYTTEVSDEVSDVLLRDLIDEGKRSGMFSAMGDVVLSLKNVKRFDELGFRRDSIADLLNTFDNLVINTTTPHKIKEAELAAETYKVESYIKTLITIATEETGKWHEVLPGNERDLLVTTISDQIVKSSEVFMVRIIDEDGTLTIGKIFEGSRSITKLGELMKVDKITLSSTAMFNKL